MPWNTPERGTTGEGLKLKKSHSNLDNDQVCLHLRTVCSVISVKCGTHPLESHDHCFRGPPMDALEHPRAWFDGGRLRSGDIDGSANPTFLFPDSDAG